MSDQIDPDLPAEWLDASHRETLNVGRRRGALEGAMLFGWVELVLGHGGVSWWLVFGVLGVLYFFPVIYRILKAETPP